MPPVTHALQQSSILIPHNTWMPTAANSAWCSVQHHHITWNENKWFLACLHVPVLFAIAGWDTHPILGQNLRYILWNISVEMGTLNVYKSFGNMSGFEGPWGELTSCINISCLGVGVCLSLLLMLPPQCMHFVHRFPAPYLQRLRFQQWSEVSEACEMGNTAVICCPLCPTLTLMTDIVYSPPYLYSSPHSLLAVMWGGQSWMLRIWAHQYTHRLLFFCIALNINTIYSLHKDNVKLTSFIKWHVHVLAFIVPCYENYFFLTFMALKSSEIKIKKFQYKDSQLLCHNCYQQLKIRL